MAQAVATVLRRGEIQRSAVIIDDDTVDIPRRGTADQSVPYITQYEVGVPTESLAPTATRGRRSGDAERTDLHVAVLRGLESLAVVGIHHHLALGAVALPPHPIDVRIRSLEPALQRLDLGLLL